MAPEAATEYIRGVNESGLYTYSPTLHNPLPGQKGEIMDENYQQDAGQKYGGGSGMSGSASGTAARLKEQISDKAADVKERVSDFGRKAADKIDASRGPAADSLNRTASALHAKSDRVASAAHATSDRVASAAHATADKLQATAEYVRDHDFKEMAEDVSELVKRYPGQSLAAAAILGFLLARVMRSSD
jgi:ElaB/YqjD/DUF883 family membrane-anchored ribosome-binding protein